jgi:hypothetical protein
MRITRRNVLRSALAIPAFRLPRVYSASKTGRLAEVGWVWEGQGLDPGVYPSIFGVGEGCKYFGLTRAVYIFHPNDELAMEKLKHLDEIVCDITKWRFKRNEDGGTVHWADSHPDAVKKEAENVGRLSLKYPNITGAFHDDMWGLVRREGYGPDRYGEIHKAVKANNPKLKLWVVVYTSELKQNWAPFAPYIDVVNLWEGNSRNLPELENNIARCRELFPGKPINMGCYMRDYGLREPVAMDLLKHQWECVARGVKEGTLAGYSVLAAVLIDGQQEQARWIRDFIASN